VTTDIAGEPAPGRSPLSGSAALRRSGLAIAAGTLASRVTGFLRTAVIGVALGYTIGDPYNTANTIPNILYDLLLGGVLSAVVVPLLVEAARRDDDGGEAYAQRLLTLVVLVLGAISAIAVIFAPALVGLYAGSLHPQARALAIDFGRFFLPQILFYGAGAVIGAVLNTRDRFAAPMWAPVINNVIVIVTGAVFYAMIGAHPQAGTVHGTTLWVLGLGTTAGIVGQTLVLLPALRRAGVHWRPRWDFRGMGLRRAGGFAGWTFAYVIVNQLGYVVVTRLAGAAGTDHGSEHVGYSAYTYAYVLFSLPYALVAVTVVTAAFPAMTRSAASGELGSVRLSLDRGVSLAGVLLVPATAALIAFGPLITTVVLAHGHITVGQALITGAVLAAFAVGLVPFAAFQMQFRAWLALRDARTPALINLAATALNVLADIVLYLALPARDKVIGLAVGFSLSYVVALAMSTRGLHDRLPWLARGPRVLRTYIRLGLATVIAVVPSYALDRALLAVGGHGFAMTLLTLVVAAVAGLVIFVLIARLLRISELDSALQVLRRRAGRAA
jgi:putative peptidoglycan lipid II flippase